MDTFELRYRHQPLRMQPRWMLLVAVLASLGMLVLASVLAGPAVPPLH